MGKGLGWNENIDLVSLSVKDRVSFGGRRDRKERGPKEEGWKEGREKEEGRVARLGSSTDAERSSSFPLRAKVRKKR